MNRREFLKGILAGFFGGVVGRLWPGRREQTEPEIQELATLPVQGWMQTAMVWDADADFVRHYLNGACVGIIRKPPIYDENCSLKVAIHYGHCGDGNESRV